MRRIVAFMLAAVALLAAGCTSSARPGAGSPGGGTNGTAGGQGSPGHSASGRPVGPPGTQASGVLRLGLEGNLADAAAMLGWQQGFFGQNLGRVTLQPMPYTSSAGEAAALQAGQLDAAYLDPVTALQLWQRSRGRLIKVIAGAASGGAELVVAPKVTTASQLSGLKLAEPAEAGQQAAASSWLTAHHLATLAKAGAAVPLSGTGLLQEFRAGKIAGAWETPPLNVQLAVAGGHVLVDEASLWPGGTYPTAVMVVTQKFLAAKPGAVTGLLRGQVLADRYLSASPVSAQAALAQRLAAMGAPLPPPVLARSFTQFSYTENPYPAALATEARHAAAAGLVKPAGNITGIFDLGPLNQVLKSAGQQEIST
jgi:NitT/TauT family transport system substrate-binding protein